MILYRIVENFDPYNVDNGNYVVSGPRFTIVYNLLPGTGQTETLVIAFRDTFEAWLCAAEPQVMAHLPTPRVALQAWINALGPWNHWRCDGHDDNTGEDFKNSIEAVDLPSDVSAANPKDLGNNRYAIGGKATAAARLGPFRPSEIEGETTWRGDEIPPGLG